VKATRVVTVEDADLRAAVAALLVERGHAVTAADVRFAFGCVYRSGAHPDGYQITASAEYAMPLMPPAEAGEVPA
jgi:hypothetical protein